MSAGQLWGLPGGHRAIELDGSTRTVLRVAVIRPNWPFPNAPQEVARDLCERLPMRYHGASVEQDGEALL